MPRSNRPRGRKREEHPQLDLARVRGGWRRVETVRGVRWNVQPISAERALKTYVCGGCQRAIEPGVAHLVVWQAEGILGDAAALEGRRHWHEYCWRR